MLAVAVADESELVRLAVGGRPEAFEELVRRYQGVVWRLARRLTGNDAEAQDVCQEAFLTVYRNLHRFELGRPFRPWLVTVATRVGLNMLRSRRPTEPYEDRHLDPGPGPQSEVETRLEVARLMAAVQQLAPNPRAIVVLHYVEGMSCAEIGEVLEMSESAVKVALFRARERLRKRLA